ncbi:holo-ACP synthase [Euzebya tangerina]|uniref:holo-ACP synthase n=1 Tax=Euzebya tangerina TaxID=591198 RepID=UPI000E31B26B|nr:holo-ACP synthase [Euzebya tangerina]
MIVGVGIDLIEIERVRTALARTPSMHDRLFTPGEQAYCDGRVSSLAARFAAKEAVSKSLGSGIRGFTFLEIEVTNDELRRPSVVLHGRAAEVAADLEVDRVHLSISTSDTIAAAYAVAERDVASPGSSHGLSPARSGSVDRDA